MARLLRSTIAVAIGVEVLWRFLDSPPNQLRDLFLYNGIWLLSLGMIIAAPLSFDRVALAAIALAILAWGIGSLISTLAGLSESASEVKILPQLLYSIFYPLMLVAIPRLSARPTRLRPLELLDSLIFGLGLTSILSALIYVIIFPKSSLPGVENYFLIFYPIGDLALLLISLLTLLTRKISREILIFIAGILIFAVTDFYYLWLSFNARYSFGDIADSGWLIAITLFSLSVQQTKNESFGDVSPLHPAIVATSIFVSPILLALSVLNPELLPRFILIPAIANILLGFIRMSTALGEARTLGDERVLARTDELTGLANRRRLLAEIEEFSEVEGALLLLDLDGFKPINDQYGHEVGDTLLQQISRRFTRTLPHGALIARLGGDEFGVLVRGSYEETLEAAYALRACLTYPFSIDGKSIQVNVSVGIVHNDGAGDLLKRADSAMYRAKQMDMGVAHS